jgi:hypothetical protein
VLVDRLIVEGSDGVETMDLHPRLTVVGGMPPDARLAFYNLLSGALHGTTRGVHVEVRDENGRHLVVLRPGVGQGRVIDVDSSTDVSVQYRNYEGTVDVFAAAGGHRGLHRITAEDLAESAAEDDAVRALSAVDQGRLWATADAAAQDGPGSKAYAKWADLTDNFDLGWALEHRGEIDAAAQLRQHIGALRSLSSSVPDLSDEEAIALAHGIVSRVGYPGQHQVTVPLILDEPFVNLEPAVIPLLLELLPGLVGDLQVMLLTNDDAIASWARLEALAGELALVEPALAG